ncbi:MAG: MarC family protein, partial [Paracoccaceae bacterium]|nr:MarC family protein [Paracoccaceae bacterium]
ALDMLFERRTKRREDKVADLPDPSVFPLATPLIAGPGSIATVILLMGQAEGVAGSITIIAVLAAVICMVFLFFIAGGLLEKLIGQTGINVITRLLGMLLAALAIQFILDGLLTVQWPV